MPALPKDQWAKLPASQRGNWSYQKYRSWVGRTEMKRQFRAKLAQQGQTYDPYFAPTNAAALQKMARGIVSSNTLPLIQALQKQIEAQRKAGSAEINANTQQLVKSWAPFKGDVANIYNQSIGQQQASDKTLADYVKNAGAQAATSLTGAGAQAGASPEAQAANQALAQTGAGAAAATYGLGSASLDRLLSDKASGVSYAASLPGRARDMGAWNLAALTRQLDQALSSGTADIQGKVPGMVSDVMQQLMNRELEKATARQGFAMDSASLQQKTQAAQQKAQQGLGIPNSAVTRMMNDGNVYDKFGNVIGKGAYVTGQGGGKGGMTDNQRRTRLKTVMANAGKTANTLYAQLQAKLNPKIGGVTTPLTGKARMAALEYGRHNVTTAVMGYLKQQYPGQSAGWYRSNAATVLEGAGWHIPAARLRQPGMTSNANYTNTFPRVAGAPPGTPAASGGAPVAPPRGTRTVTVAPSAPAGGQRIAGYSADQRDLRDYGTRFDRKGNPYYQGKGGNMTAGYSPGMQAEAKRLRAVAKAWNDRVYGDTVKLGRTLHNRGVATPAIINQLQKHIIQAWQADLRFGRHDLRHYGANIGDEYAALRVARAIAGHLGLYG